MASGALCYMGRLCQHLECDHPQSQLKRRANTDIFAGQADLQKHTITTEPDKNQAGISTTPMNGNSRNECATSMPYPTTNWSGQVKPT